MSFDENQRNKKTCARVPLIFADSVHFETVSKYENIPKDVIIFFVDKIP
jgi:hypothetical protein